MTPDARQRPEPATEATARRVIEEVSAIGRPETWKPVCGYEGLYEVSDYGRVRSLDRWVRYRDGRGRWQPGRVLKLLPDGNGYLRVNLAGATRHVHSLVLEAFAGRCAVGMERLHGPGGRADNRWPENLRYGSKSENLGADKHRDGTMVHAKLNELAVLEFLDRRARGDSYATIARDYGVTVPTVWNAVTGRSWRHVDRGAVVAAGTADLGGHEKWLRRAVGNG